jgi:hypothetical protein
MHRQDPVGAGQGAKISGSASKKAKRGTSGNIGTISGRTARAVSRGLRLGRHADFWLRIDSDTPKTGVLGGLSPAILSGNRVELPQIRVGKATQILGLF